MVQFKLCEVDSGSALAWIGFARAVLLEVESTGIPEVPAETMDVVRDLLEEWAKWAATDEVFSLQMEMPADQFEFLAHLLLQLSAHATDAADRRGYDVSPPEADEFFAALSEAFICALENSGEDSTVEFATGLRSVWPRTDRLMADGSFVSVASRFDPGARS